MSLQATLEAGWARHADAPDAVLGEALALVDHAPAEHMAAVANLLFHVGGEHLGAFQPVADAVAAMLDRAPEPTAAAPLHRVLAACALCLGDVRAADEHEARVVGDAPARTAGLVRGLVASALAGRGRATEAAGWFEAVVALAETEATLHRSVAVTGNNLAAALERSAARTQAEGALMLRAAEVARVYWEKAGTWMNVERAEYRLAMTRLARGEADAALPHALQVLALVDANGGDPGERFFGFEATARAHSLGGSPAAAREARDHAAGCLEAIPDEGFRGFCVTSLAELDARLAAEAAAG